MSCSSQNLSSRGFKLVQQGLEQNFATSRLIISSYWWKTDFMILPLVLLLIHYCDKEHIKSKSFLLDTENQTKIPQEVWNRYSRCTGYPHNYPVTPNPSKLKF